VDPNLLQRRASEFARTGRYADALKIYFYMAEGDPSLDGGSLGHNIGVMYEKLGDLHAAKYWYARAYEENPGIDAYKADYERTRNIGIDNLL
jgi:tetratricopeptide (TPR) repeat protein